jgi:phosphoglycerate-specific signal transduction histidine kinase
MFRLTQPAWLGRLGIKVKLQAAFAAAAAMTVIAAVVAITSFSAAERGVERVANHEVPLMTDALRLSATSGEISAGPRASSAPRPPTSRRRSRAPFRIATRP